MIRLRMCIVIYVDRVLCEVEAMFVRHRGTCGSAVVAQCAYDWYWRQNAVKKAALRYGKFVFYVTGNVGGLVDIHKCVGSVVGSTCP